ncbi:MAG: tRNA threonylcarbamoyladenosine dehydratase [Bacteroidales bacterium]|nr:tRNA threonylcarbamoyladenosine dehydratase [Bacteroidales bacterium]
MKRTVQLLGEEKCRKLMEAHVLVAGMGGVGAMAAEMLVRAGIGRITLADSDVVQASNINRQVGALHSTIGRAKAEVMKERLLDINPQLEVSLFETFINEESVERLLGTSFDFVVDAIDTLTPKIVLIEHTVKQGLRLVSSMGSGGKSDPSVIAITEFEKTYNCRLAYLLRKKLRKRGVEGGFRVVFSTEQVDREQLKVTENERNKKSVPGTVSYTPAIFGCMLSAVVVEELTMTLA